MSEGKPAEVRVSMIFSARRHNSIIQSKGSGVSLNNKDTQGEPESLNSSNNNRIPIPPDLIVNRESFREFSSNRIRRRRRARCPRASEA